MLSSALVKAKTQTLNGNCDSNSLKMKCSSAASNCKSNLLHVRLLLSPSGKQAIAEHFRVRNDLTALVLPDADYNVAPVPSNELFPENGVIGNFDGRTCRKCVPAQPVDATLACSLLAGVSKPKVFRGR